VDIRCAYCQEMFYENDAVQVLPPVVTVRRGEKSGQLGLYGESQMPEQEYVHVECASAFFNLDGSDYETLETKIREAARHELYEEVREQVVAELADRSNRICAECLEERDEDEEMFEMERRQEPQQTGVVPFPPGYARS
jgi:hypothetical protein